MGLVHHPFKPLRPAVHVSAFKRLSAPPVRQKGSLFRLFIEINSMNAGAHSIVLSRSAKPLKIPFDRHMTVFPRRLIFIAIVFFRPRWFIAVLTSKEGQRGPDHEKGQGFHHFSTGCARS
jgi:hypothetical protein